MVRAVALEASAGDYLDGLRLLESWAIQAAQSIGGVRPEQVSVAAVIGARSCPIRLSRFEADLAALGAEDASRDRVIALSVAGDDEDDAVELNEQG